MKKTLSVLVAFALGVGVDTLLRMERAPVAEAGQGSGCAPLLMTSEGVVIQDMNGDGVLDPIAEAVRLLGWAFLGAPAPPPPCVADGSSGLPDTGQVTCYEGALEVPCDTASCSGQDGRYATGCPSEGRFVDNADGTVTDTCTGLVWQKETADANGDGRSTDQDSIRWCDALALCENLSFAGHDDWRLPNIRELQSIVDYGASGAPIDPVFGSFPSAYWSSTTITSNRAFAWVVIFDRGFVNIDLKAGGIYCRAVRSGP